VSPFKALRAGDLVAIVAPAGPALPERLPRVEALFAQHGLRTRLYPGCYQSQGYLAGPDAQRLADLHAAFADDEVAAVVCLRGGYGSMRLLANVDVELIRRKPKLLVGYSDITALHALLHGAGVPSLHAPMPASDLVHEGHEEDAQAFFALLLHGMPAGHVMHAGAATALRREGVCEGPIVGGNLSLVGALCGTPFAVRAQGAILFLEDINEDTYRVDRLLCQLKLAGVLDAASGFLIGSFTEGGKPDGVLAQYLHPLRKPVLDAWPAGHGTPNRALPIGVKVRLDAAAGTVTLLEGLMQTSAVV
jgi:muramoyltetrapeptide carboxypeptidase